jgi:signal transduction histidine kinase
MEQFIVQFSDGIQLLNVNIDRASALVTSFKQVSADQSHDEIRTINLKDYLEETIYTLKPNLKRYQVKVSLECEPEIDLDTFPGAYSQLLTNLIMNSLHHGYLTDDEGTITIKVGQDNDLIYLVYSDDGKGMPEKVLKKIFEPFFTTKRGSGGTGLGMHIVFNIVTMKLQGKIIASSTEGEGARFSLTLPKALTNPNL